MKKFSYFNELFRSTAEVFKKPILLMPFIYVFLLSAIFLLFSPTLDPENIETTVLLTAIGLVLIQALIALIFEGAALIAYREHLANKELNLVQQIAEGLKVYGKLLLLKLIQALIILVPAAILLLILVFTTLAEGGTIGNTTAGLITLFIILYGIYALFAGLALLFSTVAASNEKTSAFSALKESYSLLKKNTSHTFLTGLMIFLYAILYIIIATTLTTLTGLALGLTEESIWLEIILSLLTIPLGGIMLLYVFKAFQQDKEEVEPQPQVMTQTANKKKNDTTTKKSTKKQASKKKTTKNK